MQLLIKKINSEAKLPEYAHTTDAGMDFFCLEEFSLQPGERRAVSTGIQMAIPEGHVGLIWDKSSVPFNTGVKTMAGVIDAGYRGEIKILLINHSPETVNFKKYQKIAQMLIQPIIQPQLVETADLDATERGIGSFGSTGI